jgi:hypothetical protein
MFKMSNAHLSLASCINLAYSRASVGQAIDRANAAGVSPEILPECSIISSILHGAVNEFDAHVQRK